MYEGKNLDNLNLNDLKKLKKNIETALLLVQNHKDFIKNSHESEEISEISAQKNGDEDEEGISKSDD